MELSPTAYVILGMVSRTPRSGYEIKALVDNSTRFFWAASYGQIYPELKRLSETGLVEGLRRAAGRSQADGLRDHRGRPRRVEGLAAAAPRDLGDARRRPAQAVLRRDARRPRRRSRSCGRCASGASSVAEQLRAMEPEAIEKDDPLPLMVLQGGIEFSQWFADWCDRMETRLLEPAPRGARPDVRLARPPRRRPRPPDRPDRDRRSSSSPAPPAARSPTGSTPTAPMTRRPSR